MRGFRFFWLLFLLLSICHSTEAQTRTYTPQPRSTERKAILTALRTSVQKELKRSVVFKVDHLKVQNSWAFLRGVPQQPRGKHMNYHNTPYQRDITLGLFDDWICALLQKKKGRWQVTIYVIGATDVAYDGWDKEYNAPSEIFK